MDYKEKYEMALETIQETLDSGSDSIKMSRLKLRLQSVFPELKESENERIRKKLIALFKGQIPSTSAEDNKKFVAWLERQGEQKPLPPIDDNYALKASKEYRKDRESCGIKDPIMLDEIETAYFAGATLKQNPAWGEEDDDDAWMNDIISKVENNLQLNKAEIEWLKSLKERIGGLTDFDVIGEVVQRNLLEEVVKQMTDTLLVETLLYRKKQGTLSIFYDERKENLERFLKSICTWKPSDEQMATLEYYMHTLVCNSYKETLFGLYQDLKKLREE